MTGRIVPARVISKAPINVRTRPTDGNPIEFHEFTPDSKQMK